MMKWQNVLLKRNPFLDKWTRYCKKCADKNDDVIVFDRKGQQGVERQKKYDEAKSKRLGSLREVDDT